jgi:hypothetical protein
MSTGPACTAPDPVCKAPPPAACNISLLTITSPYFQNGFKVTAGEKIIEKGILPAYVLSSGLSCLSKNKGSKQNEAHFSRKWCVGA